MIEYLKVKDQSYNPKMDITENGKLMELGAEGWDAFHIHNENGKREWFFKRVLPKIEEKKKRGRPAGSKNKKNCVSEDKP